MAARHKPLPAAAGPTIVGSADVAPAAVGSTVVGPAAVRRTVVGPAVVALVAVALAAACASAPAAAEPRPPQVPNIPDVHVSAPGVSKHGVKLPGVSIERKAEPRVSVPGVSILDDPRPRRMRPKPEVSTRGIKVYDDAVCVDGPTGSVLVGRCGPMREPVKTPRAPVPTRGPVLMVPDLVRPTPSPTPTPSVKDVRAYAPHPIAPLKRPNPLATVLIMVVLTTVIASTTAVAFGAVR
ncbi:hypothetical protein ACIBQX_02295 [Nonomuraea sp. NPDC049714]|uniref:hypothetical protein n=1 Tax=Nonomuraea sp. NPDC049714 TaxID=3364357 RepID=UPI00378CCFD1